MTSAELAKSLLESMWLIRAFEEKLAELKAADKAPGLLHISIGQEAVAAGVCEHLSDQDYVYSSHRANGHFLAKGADPALLMAELTGRESGLCRGKGGSMHLADPSHGLLGATGVVGGNIPLALGTALAAKERGRGQATVVFFGDGAAQTGYFHESLNLASLWELPVILVCENNGYAEFTPRSAHTRVANVADLARPYDIPTAVVDGNDAVTVYEAARPFVDATRSGRGPALLECLTSRLRGHYEGDPQRYREATELAEWRAKDPILRLAGAATASRLLTQEGVDGIEAGAREAVQMAVQFALSSSEPSPSTLSSHVYA